MIKKIPMKVFLIILLCDKCMTEMVSDNEILLCDPPKYKYTCPKCGNEEITTTDSPSTVYEEA